MRNWFRGSMIAVTAATVLAVVSLSVTRTTGQTQRIARIDGKPNLSGIWQAMNEANWDLEAHQALPSFYPHVPGIHPLEPRPNAVALALGAVAAVPGSIGVVQGDGKIPYQPWALAQREENRLKWLDRDGEVQCFLAGIPRSMYLAHPFQVFQGGNKIEMSFQYSSSGRTINLDKVEPLPDDTYNGFSVGRWEGDTLVTEVTGFNNRTWFDRSGNFHSDGLKVTERFTPLGNINDMFAMRYEATIDDPRVFTRSWQISMPLYRRLEPNAQLLNFRCQEFSEELHFGHLRKQNLVKRYEGRTLIVDITRKIPRTEEELYMKEWINEVPKR